MENNKTNQHEYSQEDLKKMRDENTDFLKEQIEHLAVQEEYTGLKAKIAENRYKEQVYKIKFAELTAPKEPQPEPEKDSKKTK